MPDTSPRVIEFFLEDLVILRMACAQLAINPPAQQIRLTLHIATDDFTGCLRRLILAKMVEASLRLVGGEGQPPAVLNGTIQDIVDTLTPYGHTLEIDFVAHDPDTLPTH
jgi:hypothetical protein